MKNIYKIFSLLVVILLVVAAFGMFGGAQPAKAAVGFHISGRNLLDSNNNNFIIRGISHAYVWYTGQNTSFANIKAKGANTVRVVLGGGRWGPTSASEITTIINLCKTNKLICVLEDHDTTGYGEQSGSTSLATAVNYWKSVQSALTGQENYIIINIGNEPYGNNNASNWIAETKSAIAAMRSAGFQHTLMVDAPNWGQDWQFNMRDNAASVFASDTAKNTIFSIHMYGVFDTAAEITSYVSAFASAGLPLVIGEFGNNHSDGNPDEDTIMSTAVSQGIGYMGWSWCGNSSDVAYLDMVNNWDPNSLTTWGDRLINGANGIKATSREASVYGGPVGPTATFTRTPTAGPTATRTNTPTVGPSLTPTRTPTAGGPTATTPPGGACSPVTATITAPFTKDGAGTFCWQSTNLGAYINSWNLVSLTVNGTNYTNVYVAAGSYPAKINGNWYVSYNSTVAWGHFEAK